jgi:glucose-1-phosphate thymidylyltransferase
MLSDDETKKGATVLAQSVADPSRYGIVEFDKSGRAVSIQEKPNAPRSSFAIPGLYFLDNTASARARAISPSSRGELEITDVLQSYLNEGSLEVKVLPRGTAWLDTGTIESLFQASEFVKVVEQRQGFKIACPEEIAWRMGYISDDDLKAIASEMKKTEYGEYLAALLA